MKSEIIVAIGVAIVASVLVTGLASTLNAQSNMTGGNMTGGNMTGGNMTGGNMRKHPPNQEVSAHVFYYLPDQNHINQVYK